MLILFSYVCVDLFTDLYVINQTKKESLNNVYIIMNCKWFLFLLYYYHSNKRNIRSISV